MRWDGLEKEVEMLRRSNLDDLIVSLPVFTLTVVDNPPAPGKGDNSSCVTSIDDVSSDGIQCPLKLRKSGLRKGDTLYFAAVTTILECAHALATHITIGGSKEADEVAGSPTRRLLAHIVVLMHSQFPLSVEDRICERHVL